MKSHGKAKDFRWLWPLTHKANQDDRRNQNIHKPMDTQNDTKTEIERQKIYDGYGRQQKKIQKSVENPNMYKSMDT